MVTGGGGGARPASIHDANGRGPRVLSHASLRMHALTVHPSARRSTRYACTHRSPMHVSPSMRCVHSRCEWPRLVLACTPRPSMHVSPLMRAAAYSTHALSLPSYACDRIHRRLRSDLLRVLSYSCSWVWDFQIPSRLYSSLHPLVSKPAFNLHAGMPVESKPIHRIYGVFFNKCDKLATAVAS